MTAILTRVTNSSPEEENWAESVGRSGLLGLGFLGLITLLLSYFLRVPLRITIPMVTAIAIVAGILTVWRGARLRMDLSPSWGLLAILAPFGAISVIGALAPAEMLEWDSLAYHLAVPKLWLARDSVDFVQNIHHSNFPFVWDMLYVHGLHWGGEVGAKTFNVLAYLLGALWVFGISTRWFSRRAAFWSTIAFLSIPVALWQSGTAYIDLAHGLFAAIGVCSLADALRHSQTFFTSHRISYAGIGVGMAMGSKHTGLQVLLACVIAAVAVLFLARRAEEEWRSRAKVVAVVSFMALLLAAPWYLKSLRETGNPVYPFFSSVFPSREWDSWRSQIYTEEQRSFGVGQQPIVFGHAVLGLAYQPGRYANPGQMSGLGFPFAGIGFAALLLGLLAALRPLRHTSHHARFVLVYSLIVLALWFLQSQQSRYLTILVIPLSVVAGALTLKPKEGTVAKVVIATQAVVTVVLVWILVTSDQLRPILGFSTRHEYREQRVPFSRAAARINELPEGAKVALYDEVFGFLIDREYVWANPGHSSWIGYERMQGGGDLRRELADKGFTHVYVNLDPGLVAPSTGDRWLSAAGLLAQSDPYREAEKEDMRSDLNLWWRWLVADAVRQGALRPIDAFGQVNGRPRALLFEIAR